MMKSSYFIIRNIDKKTFITILPKFFKEIKSDFKFLTQKINSREVARSYQIAHKMKGDSTIYGATPLVNLLDQLEGQLERMDDDQSNDILAALEKEINTAILAAQTEFSIAL